jgi:hypothetical protein
MLKANHLVHNGAKSSWRATPAQSLTGSTQVAFMQYVCEILFLVNRIIAGVAGQPIVAQRAPLLAS